MYIWYPHYKLSMIFYMLSSTKQINFYNKFCFFLLSIAGCREVLPLRLEGTSVGLFWTSICSLRLFHTMFLVILNLFIEEYSMCTKRCHTKDQFWPKMPLLYRTFLSILTKKHLVQAWATCSLNRSFIPMFHLYSSLFLKGILSD